MANQADKARSLGWIDAIADWLIGWIGSTASLVIHTLFFIVIFALRLAHISTESILLILTTVVSLEAIYLSILIQRTVNKSSQALAEVTEDLEEVTEDIGEIQEDIDEIQEDIDEIQEDDEPTPSKQPILKQVRALRLAIAKHETMLSTLEEELEQHLQKKKG